YWCPSRTLCPRYLQCQSGNTVVCLSQQTLPSSLPPYTFVPCPDNALCSSQGVTLLRGIRD
ncbi:unnamed protein product, partial [Bubo scandiacus]